MYKRQLLQGRAHYYEAGEAAVMATPLATLAALGVRTLLLTNSAGSLRADWRPGRIVAIADHINLSGANPLIGETSDRRFVSMTDAYDPALRAEWELTQKLKRDPRITPLGRLIRKTSLDELPQLINVIRGDMSLVGPRPMLPDQLPLYRAPAAYLGLRPGLTGLWQVTARNAESFDLRAQIDQAYARRVTFARDLKIMAATFGALWNATGY